MKITRDKEGYYIARQELKGILGECTLIEYGINDDRSKAIDKIFNEINKSIEYFTRQHSK